MAQPLIRKAIPADLAAILRIEDQSFASPNWDAEAFARYRTAVAEIQNEVAGVLVVRQTYEGDHFSHSEFEILNLAVGPAFRRRGVASALLQWLFADSGEFFLEVRESNEAAQSLYRKFRFEIIGSRPAYYANPVESALVMKMKRC